MKKNILVMAFGMAAVLMTIPCHSKAEITTNGLTEYIIPDDDDDRGDEVKLTDAEKYAEKNPAKRSAGKGQSFKETSAEVQARLAARANFAEALRAAVLSAAKNVYGEANHFFADEATGDGADEGKTVSQTEAAERQNTLLKSITNEVIQNTVQVKKNKFYNKKRRRYTIYVCLEYNGEVKDMVEQTVKKVRERIPLEDRKRLDENLEKFEFEIEQELNKTVAPSSDEEE